MKKRMFLTSILMTLVLLLAVTTATFAWYTAGGNKANAGEAAHKTVNVAGNAYTDNGGVFVFNPTLTVGNEKPAMTDANGNVKYYVGTTLVTDPADNLVRYGTGTVAINSTVAANGGATIENIYDELASQSGYAKVIVTITSADARVKFFTEVPTQTEGGYAGQSSISFTVNMADLTSTEVLAATNFYWA